MFVQKERLTEIILAHTKFIGLLTWYTMMCMFVPFKKKAEYVKGFKTLQDAYEDVQKHSDIDGETKTAIQNMFNQVVLLLRRRKFDGEIPKKIAEILLPLQDESSNLIVSSVRQMEISSYERGLIEKVSPLLAAGSYDEVVLNSFKFLDSYLQKLLMFSSHESYGEDLINRAFAPNSGVLQLNTHPNEQAGLRNFVSGANAIFRNPSAHRLLLDAHNATFRGDAAFYAGAVVTLVELIVRISTELYVQKYNQEIVNLFTHLIEKNGWLPYVVSYAKSWSVAPFSKETMEKFGKRGWQSVTDYRLVLRIVSEVDSLHFQLYYDESVTDEDLQWLAKELKNLTKLRVQGIKRSEFITKEIEDMLEELKQQGKL